MTIPAKYLIRIVLALGVAAGLLAALVLPSLGQAARGKTEILRVYDKVVSIRVTHPDGTVVTKEPLPDPKPGDTLDAVALDYAGTHAHHARRPLGSSHVRCVFAAAGPPDCLSHVAIGGSMLVFAGNPGRLVLGTGRYLGARGRVVSATSVGGGDDTDIAARITRRR